MMKRYFMIILVVIALLASACSQADTAAQDEAAGTDARSQFGSQLVMMTFALEGTDQAVTPAQAQELLPLWKAARAIMESDTAAVEELDAVYRQIESAMTSDQLSLMQDGVDPEALNQLMEELGITAMQPRSGESQDFQAGGDPGMAPPEGGGPGGGPGGGTGGGPGGGAGMTDLTPEQQATLQAERQAAGGGAGMGRASGLIDPLIALLETRAAE